MSPPLRKSMCYWCRLYIPAQHYHQLVMQRVHLSMVVYTAGCGTSTCCCVYILLGSFLLIYINILAITQVACRMGGEPQVGGSYPLSSVLLILYEGRGVCSSGCLSSLHGVGGPWVNFSATAVRPLCHGRFLPATWPRTASVQPRWALLHGL